jgi:hypothetical protein
MLPAGHGLGRTSRTEGGGRGDTDRPGWVSNPEAEAPATASASRSATLFIGIPSRNPSRNFWERKGLNGLPVHSKTTLTHECFLRTKRKVS